MLKLIVGVKGTGKTKMLIDMANGALEESKGCVVCIEKGTKLIHAINYHARLLDVDEYVIHDSDTLYGFIAGIYASNHDVTHIFIDSALKICNNDVKAFEKLVEKVEGFGERNGISFIITASLPVEELSEKMARFTA